MEQVTKRERFNTSIRSHGALDEATNSFPSSILRTGFYIYSFYCCAIIVVVTLCSIYNYWPDFDLVGGFYTVYILHYFMQFYILCTLEDFLLDFVKEQ